MLDVSLELSDDMQDPLRHALMIGRFDDSGRLPSRGDGWVEDLENDLEEDQEDDTFENDGEGCDACNGYASENLFTLANLRHPLLRQEEEYHLAKQLKHGSPEERQAARDRLVACNQRLVVKIAKKWGGQGVAVADLMQEGNIGLLTAIERYDPERGFRFSTYATWWIRQAVGRAVGDQGRLIRLPVYKTEEVYHYKCAYEQLEIELQRAPGDEEVAQRIGVSVESIREWMLVSSPTSLSFEIDEGYELGDVLPDQSDDGDVEERGVRGPIAAQMNEALAALTPRERTVIELRFGFSGHREHTLKETGELLGVTRERIRQIEEKALKKLRGSQPIQALVS